MIGKFTDWIKKNTQIITENNMSGRSKWSFYERDFNPKNKKLKALLQYFKENNNFDVTGFKIENRKS